MRNVHVKHDHCCGGSCAEVIVGEGLAARRVAKEFDHSQDYWEWKTAKLGSKEETIFEWRSWLNAVKTALKTAVRLGEITQEEADQALEDWLRDHPNPEEEALDVTEEFYKLHPAKIEVEQ